MIWNAPNPLPPPLENYINQYTMTLRLCAKGGTYWFQLQFTCAEVERLIWQALHYKQQ